jgi:hypothetical protein
MKPIVNFNQRLEQEQIVVNGKYFRLSPDIPTLTNWSVVSIWPDCEEKVLIHHKLEIDWTNMCFRFYRVRRREGFISYKRTEILYGTFDLIDCRDHIVFMNNVICRNIDKLMSDGTYYY